MRWHSDMMKGFIPTSPIGPMLQKPTYGILTREELSDVISWLQQRASSHDFPMGKNTVCEG
jgi:hypothetical protein